MALRFRDYQQTQIAKIVTHLSNKKSAQRAQVYSPTGSGKTVVFMEIVRRFKSVTKIRGPLNIAIVHPRIALSQDQLKRFKSEFGSKFKATSFHSGQHYRADGDKEISTCLVDELEAVIDRHTGDHVTFSSYKSFPKIVHKEFDLLICDEAHNMVPGDNDDNTLFPKAAVLQSIKAKRVLFFTATPINDEAEECEGMNNDDMFGKIICETPAKPLIIKGYITGPVIQTLQVKTDKKGKDGVNTTQIIGDAYLKQREYFKKHSRLNTIQMLVCSRGYSDHEKIESELQTLWKIIGEPVDVFVVEASESRLNGRRLNSRIEALEMIAQNGKDGKSTIVIHYDTLAEGIDIASLTGVVILRKMKKSKILQTIGRAGRPHWLDLDANGEIKDMNNRVKPFCILTLPVVDGVHLGGQTARDYARAFVLGGYADLVDMIDRSGSADAKGKKKTTESEDRDPFFSEALSFKAKEDASHIVETGILFSF